MILEELKICDFRVISDEETISLTPQVRAGRKRPIVLFGGLNGAGKTTTLTAIRLALYGKHSLGSNVSIREYKEYLKESIHKSKKANIRKNSAKIHLTFSYATRGKVSRYTIKREWTANGGKVHEILKIEKDGQVLSGLNDDQCQNFLNELIPIGVSDLFFFDGEKIAELAEDTTGRALGTAIRKLLGLDVINRMRDDLAIYLREKNTLYMPEQHQQIIGALKEKYDVAYATYEAALNEKSEAIRQVVVIDSDIRESESYISSKGGAWARSRNEEQARLEQLIAEKKHLEEQIRTSMGTIYPLVLAIGRVKNLLNQLEKEQDFKRQAILKGSFDQKVELLKSSLLQSINDKQAVEIAINNAFTELFDEIEQIDIVHDCSERQFNRVQLLLENIIPASRQQMLDMGKQLADIQSQLDHASENLQRAPDVAFLKDELKRLRELNEKRTAVKNRMAVAKDDAKNALREAMDIMRQMQKKEQESSVNFSSNRAYQMAQRSRELLNVFASKATENKVKQLEKEFVKSFRKLARKDDISLRAWIDPKNFGVKLLDKQGNEINKKQLSAGEKQIFAISILEALARTSGRKLPIIIDTPLGRLDSKHRGKLVENYFPTASHQVIILSTDTEIDQDYFRQLSPHISHVYEVEYFPKEGYSEYLRKHYFGFKISKDAENKEQELAEDVA
ncbi:MULTISPECIES: DNA sulfur modification protein DndD [unclassified Endozoicomonas]|uniref:DNA sulfur modification protein DndD n=1 Tax=unclassified Endozoicomonas TaxID=2644528 RepID=UPI003BB6FC2A